MNEGDKNSVTPIPDPTILTTTQLLREIASLRELLETRLAGMDRATVLLSDNVTRVPTDVDKQISHLKEMVLIKFDGVDRQFIERDVRTSERVTESNTAINAAFQAQKEAATAQLNALTSAIAKSEAATEKQIEALQTLIAATDSSLTDKIIGVTSRLDRGDGASFGSDHRKSSVMSLVSLGIAALALVFTAYNSSRTPQQPAVQIIPPTTIAPVK